MSSLFLIAFLVPLGLSLLLTPFVMRFAFKVNAIDVPDKRKVHLKPIPRLGGIAVAASFFTSAGALYIFRDFLPAADLITMQSDPPIVFGLGFIAILMVFLLGACDDVKALRAGIKFLVQFVAATLAYLAGFQIVLVSDPFGTGFINIDWFSYPITVLWIVGITNAFNLIDGLDGLASGTAVIALAVISTITIYFGQFEIVFIALVLGGATLGFLWYNFRPARIFLGDSGSLFLGFMLALLSIQSFSKVTTSFALLVPFFVLGLPIIDTFLSMIRRFLSWFLPEKYAVTNKVSFRQILSSIFQPDKSHVHHQLMQKGLSHKHTVLILYLTSAIFGAGAVAIALTTQIDTIIFTILILGVFTHVGINKLKYKEIALLHNGIFLSLYKKLLINRHSFKTGLDCLFIIISFVFAYMLTQRFDVGNTITAEHQGIGFSIILFTCLVQLSVFWFSGLYKESIHQLGITDVFRITKTVALAVSISTLSLYLFPLWHINNLFTLLIFNFYFLTTFVLGLRILFHLLKHLFRLSRQGDHKVLIYGTGEQGMLTLHRLLIMNSPNIYTPIGFLDEDPNMEGKLINGFKVYGGHWKLERLIRVHKIEYLFIATDQLKTEVQQRIVKLAEEYDLKIKTFHLTVDEIPTVTNEKEKKTKEGLLYAN